MAIAAMLLRYGDDNLRSRRQRGSGKAAMISDGLVINVPRRVPREGLERTSPGHDVKRLGRELEPTSLNMQAHQYGNVSTIYLHA
jgi:hypothetical protein